MPKAIVWNQRKDTSNKIQYDSMDRSKMQTLMLHFVDVLAPNVRSITIFRICGAYFILHHLCLLNSLLRFLASYIQIFTLIDVHVTYYEIMIDFIVENETKPINQLKLNTEFIFWWFIIYIQNFSFNFFFHNENFRWLWLQQSAWQLWIQ